MARCVPPSLIKMPPMEILHPFVSWMGFVDRNNESGGVSADKATTADIKHHEEYGGRERWKIAISGSSGLVGSALSSFLIRGGHEVLPLVRRADADRPDSVLWNPAAGFLDAEVLEGCHAVINLAGENIAAGHWTAPRKSAILESRVRSTALLARTIAGMNQPPRVFVSASAVGYYGSRGEETLTETSPAGDGFLAAVCREWESAADPAREAGIRVVHPRIGMVLAASGGVLNRLVMPFKFGLGGPVGHGRQFVSWIEIGDVVAVLYRFLFDESLEGPVNATAPRPVTNREFARTLGRILHRPAGLSLPSPLVRMLFGEMGEELLLGSARVLPAKLETAGFRFSSPDLETGLRNALGLRSPG